MEQKEIKYVVCPSCQTENSMPKSWTSFHCGSCKKKINIISNGPTKEQIIKNRIIAGITLAAGIFVAVWVVKSMNKSQKEFEEEFSNATHCRCCHNSMNPGSAYVIDLFSGDPTWGGEEAIKKGNKPYCSRKCARDCNPK